MYTIKNLRTMQGHDGGAFSATLYKDSRKVAVIVQEGHGGMTDVDFFGADRADSDRMANEFAEWVKVNCADHWIAEYVNEERGDGPAALGAEMLVERHEEGKRLARHAKTKVLFRLPDDDADGCRTLAHGGDPEAATARLRSKYPTAQFWDPTTGLWG